MERSKGVNIKNLTKIYLSHSKNSEFRAVSDISVDIQAGEFVTLLGPSGCGKTTTLRMIAGFEIPTSGDIYLGGDKINDLTPDKRDTAMVFQSYALFPHLNIYDNIAYGLKLKKMDKETIKEKVSNIIDLVGLKGMEYRSPNQLSGGQQQRVALARALVMEPGVLLFDEPLSNLDAKLRVYMRTEIRKIQRKTGITAVYVTHDQSEAMSLSDRIIIMKDGIIEQVGSPEDIYGKPKSKFVAEFIGNVNFIKGKIVKLEGDKAVVKVLDNEFKVDYSGDKKESDEVDIVLRPEAIELCKSGILEGVVISSTFMGSYQDYVVDVNGNLINIEVTNPKEKEHFEEGDKVKLNFNLETLHIV